MKIKKKKRHAKPIKGYRANLLERRLGEKICSETKGKSHAKKGIAVNDVKEEIVNYQLLPKIRGKKGKGGRRNRRRLKIK